ncbi:MAG: redoxin domain-containing protein [Thermoleophilia bacterium]|nr:redoxin domain-containing protein [Thermoleophilia bacterium]
MMTRQYRSAAVLGVLVVLAVGILGGCGSGGEGDSNGGSTVTTLAQAPDFSGSTLEGTRVSLSDYRGKPLVLAFMASW